MADEPIVLGIETSCDETGVGIVRGHTLLADTIASSMDEHARFGGVVPEVASRAHLDAMAPTVDSALAKAGLKFSDIDAIAVTAGPGLAGALLVGVAAAKAYSVGLGVPSTASTTSPPTSRSTSSNTARCPSRAWPCSCRAATPRCCWSPT